MTVNNTPDNITNNTTTNNTTETTKTSTSNPKSSSTSSSEKVDSITTLDSSGKPITKKGVWVGRDEGCAHIYKNPDTGELFGKSGATYTGSKIYPR